MTTFTNPILPGYYPDPSVIRVGEYFYLVNSTFEYFPGLPIHRSTDLVNWELVAHAINRDSQLDYSDLWPSAGLFAPTIREHNGTFYIVCTHVGGKAAQGNFIITAAHPEGPWSDPIWVDAPGIDPSLFFDESGRAWMTGCRGSDNEQYEGHAVTWLQEIDVTTGALLGEEHIVWEGALKGARWCEGPHLFFKDGWYYILTAEGGTEFLHAITIARSHDITGPYIGYPANPVMTHRHLGHTAPVQYVGHSDIFQDATGAWWAVALATRPVDGKHILGRETFLVDVVWEEDWPVFAPGRGVLPVTGETGLTSNISIERPGHVEDGDIAAHAREVITSGHYDTTRVITVRGGFFDFAQVKDGQLVLTGTAETLTEKGHPAFLAVRTPAPTSTFTAQLDSLNLSPGHSAGLAAIQRHTYQVRAELVRGLGSDVATTESDYPSAALDQLRIVERIDGTDTVHAQVEVPAGFELTSLDARIDITPTKCTATISAGSLSVSAQLGIVALATETAGGFVGAVVGPFVHGQDASVHVPNWRVDY